MSSSASSTVAGTRAPRHSSSSLSARTAASTSPSSSKPQGTAAAARPRPRTTIESNSSQNIQGATGVSFTTQDSIASNTPSSSPSSSTSASPSSSSLSSSGGRPAWSNTFAAASQAVPLPAVPRFAVKESNIPMSSKDRVKRAVPVSGNSPVPNSSSQIPPAVPRSMASGSHSARSSKSIGIASTTSASLTSSSATSIIMQSPLSSSMNPYAPSSTNSSNGPKSLVQLLASKSKDSTPTFVSLSANSTVAAAVAQIGALPPSAIPSTANSIGSTSLLSPTSSSHLRSSPSHSRLPHAEKKTSSFASHGTPTKRPHPSATAAAMLTDSPSTPGGVASEESLSLALPIGKALTLSHRGQSPNKSGLLPPTLSQKTIQSLGGSPQHSQLPRFQSPNSVDPLSSSPTQPQLQHRPSQPSPGVTRDMSRKRLSALHATPSSQYQESKTLDDNESGAEVKSSLIGNGSNGPIRAVNNTHGSLHRKKKVQAVPMLPLSKATDMVPRYSSEENESPLEHQALSHQYFHRSQPLPLPPVNGHASFRKDSLTSNSDQLSSHSNPASLSNNSSDLLGDDEEENLVQQTLSSHQDTEIMDGYSLVENSLSGVAEIQGSFEGSEEGVANVSDSFENHIADVPSAAHHGRVVSKVEEEETVGKYEQQMAQLQVQSNEDQPRPATPTHPHSVIPFADATPPGTSSPPTSLSGSHATPRTTAPAPSSLNLPRARLGSFARPFTPLAAPVISPPATPLLNNGASDVRRTGSPTRQVSHQTDKALVSENGAQILQLDPSPPSAEHTKLHRSPSTAAPAELSARGEDEVSLMYDPILKCYYEPSTNTYYQLNPFAHA